MHETLAQLESELTTVLHGLDAREAQLAPASDPEKWNIQQIVEHLVLSYRSTVGVLQTRIDKGKPTLAKPMLQQRVGQLYLITLVISRRGGMLRWRCRRRCRHRCGTAKN